MKKQLALCAAFPLCLSLGGCSGQTAGCAALIILGVIVLLFAFLRTYGSVQYSRSRRTKKRRKKEPLQSLLFTAIENIIDECV